MKYFGWIVCVITVGWWGWIGWRAIAVETGRLGPVTVAWSNLSRPTTFAGWATSNLESRSSSTGLQLQPGETAQFLVSPPNHVRHFQVRLVTNDDQVLSLDDENRDPARRDRRPNAERTFDRQAMVPVFGRYRLTIRNPAATSARLVHIQITWAP